MQNQDKQIEEMAQAVCELYKEFGSCEACDAELDIDGEPCIHECFAKAFYNAGYRKASDVAREIFDEVGELINEYLDGRSYRHEFLTKIAELKKKYTKEE
jgi:hypothetical protein